MVRGESKIGVALLVLAQKREGAGRGESLLVGVEPKIGESLLVGVVSLLVWGGESLRFGQKIGVSLLVCLSRIVK